MSEMVRDPRKLKGGAFVLVTPNGPEDGGDFGPNTTGTRTSGIQEALDYAKANRKDLYIAGGGLTEPVKGGVGYTLQETLRIPWNQNWCLDGGEYWLTYAGEEGDGVVIDSQMNCRIKLGVVVNARSPGAVVRISPTSKGPDSFSCVVASSFEFNALVGAGDVWGKPGAVQKSTGLLMDASRGGISANRIGIGEINACDVGVHVTQGCSGNDIEATWIHLTNLGLRIGDAGSANVCGNTIKAGISGDLKGTKGVQIFGQGNLLTINAHGNDPGQNIVLEETARDNLIIGLDLADGFTNRAANPTNRIIPAHPVGFSVATPPFPAPGEEIVNQYPYTVLVRILHPGRVNGWVETDANGASETFQGHLAVGQTLVLSPGERIIFAYDDPPAWRWKAVG